MTTNLLLRTPYYVHICHLDIDRFAPSAWTVH